MRLSSDLDSPLPWPRHDPTEAYTRWYEFESYKKGKVSRRGLLYIPWTKNLEFPRYILSQRTQKKSMRHDNYQLKVGHGAVGWKSS